MIGFLGGATTFFYVFNIPIYPFGVSLVVIYVVAVTYAITRHSLMDIRVAITTAGIFLVVYSVALGIPFILYNKGYYFIALCSAILFATPAPFIYGYFRKQAEDKILREERERQAVITRVSTTFADILNADDIIRSVVDIIGKTFRPMAAVFYLFDGEAYLRKEVYGQSHGYPEALPADHPLVLFLKKHGTRYLDEFRQGVVKCEDEQKTALLVKALSSVPAAAAVPFRRAGSMPGLLLLGEKAGRVYSDRDLEVLNDVAINGAMAIVNAQNYEQERKSFEEKMHDRRLKEIGLLGSAVAHQMANRLNRITAELWIAQDLLDENALQNNSRDELVSKIRECFRNYPLIIRDALSSRSIADALKRSSKKGAEPRVVRLRDLIQGGRALAEVKHPGVKIEFLEDYGEDIQLWVNDAVIQDVFANAFDNSLDAIRARRKSGEQVAGYMGRIIVRAEVRSDRVWIELEDNGIGIRPENMEKVFIPLFTTKGTENGTGLGLYAMQNLVKGQGGEIALTSEYGQWTKVCLQLPGVSSCC
jgi:signal transduction histidine kinase